MILNIADLLDGGDKNKKEYNLYNFKKENKWDFTPYKYDEINPKKTDLCNVLIFNI
jgi:hypothetical protein